MSRSRPMINLTRVDARNEKPRDTARETPKRSQIPRHRFIYLYIYKRHSVPEPKMNDEPRRQDKHSWPHPPRPRRAMCLAAILAALLLGSLAVALASDESPPLTDEVPILSLPPETSAAASSVTSSASPATSSAPAISPGSSAPASSLPSSTTRPATKHLKYTEPDGSPPDRAQKTAPPISTILTNTGECVTRYVRYSPDGPPPEGAPTTAPPIRGECVAVIMTEGPRPPAEESSVLSLPSWTSTTALSGVPSSIASSSSSALYPGECATQDARYTPDGPPPSGAPTTAPPIPGECGVGISTDGQPPPADETSALLLPPGISSAPPFATSSPTGTLLSPPSSSIAVSNSTAATSSVAASYGTSRFNTLSSRVPSSEISASPTSGPDESNTQNVTHTPPTASAGEDGSSPSGAQTTAPPNSVPESTAVTSSAGSQSTVIAISDEPSLSPPPPPSDVSLSPLPSGAPSPSDVPHPSDVPSGGLSSEIHQPSDGPSGSPAPPDVP